MCENHKTLKIIVNLFYSPTEELKKILINHKNIYFPINGGSSLSSDDWCKENVQMDNIGKNISNKNQLLNELTSIYWFWKNYDKIDYVGFNHYRRFFKIEDILDYENFDIIVSQPIWSSNEISLAYQYKYYHVIQDIQTCVDIIRSNFNYEWGESFRKYLLITGTNLAPCNMFIMKYHLFDEWCSFLFPILFQLEKKICSTQEFKQRDDYQKRALCFLTERIFNYWYFLKKQSGMKTKEVEMDEFLNFKPNGINERGCFSNKGK